jgi:hypothetical protein
MREQPLQQVRPVGFVAGCQLQSVSAPPGRGLKV